jgi:hypothetical protein
VLVEYLNLNINILSYICYVLYVLSLCRNKSIENYILGCNSKWARYQMGDKWTRY